MSDENPRQNVTFPNNGSEAHGYLAVPSSGSGPGVIVIQEWWGLTDHIAGMADRLAAEGFVALAPDLYGGKTAHDADTAGSLMMSLPVEQAALDLAGAVDFLLGHEAVTSAKLGAIGFCMGGGFVLMLAAQQGDRIAAAVPFYGVGPAVPDAYAGITAAVQGHYAENDDFFPADQARAQEQQIRSESGADVEYFFYPAGHAFNNDENLLGTYDKEQADLAWGRAVDFLKAKLG
ncbi:MAG TPA: dienelactone hydrolase family protein [Mycobacteriales bacterium]|nr:dienelactone hydrolase family protein [Mycobacteriales bacterium]